MNHNEPGMKRVLFLMSDTGGGHRAAADAIQAAMQLLYPDQYQFQTVDVFRHHTPFPFKYMPEFYPIWVNRSSFSWRVGYIWIDGRWSSKVILNFFYLFWRRGLQRLVERYPADIVVCVHSLFNLAAIRAFNNAAKTRPPFATVVTDLVSTPASWYQKGEDLCLVPTQQAYERGLRMGMRPEQMKVTGLPVHPRFVNSLTTKDQARQTLEWDMERPAVLLVSGGDGMGPVFKTARAINDLKLDMQLAIIAGRNEALQHKLESCKWNQPTRIYPFVDYMATLMTAADILITKAGPATIAEAAVAGLPMILSGKVPGQEDGNVQLVVENGAGVYASSANEVANYLADWLSSPPEQLKAYAEAARSLAHPKAAWTVAEEIHQLTQEVPLHSRQAIFPSWSLLFPRWRPKIAAPPKTYL